MSRDAVIDQLAAAALRDHPADAAPMIDRMSAKDVAGLLERLDADLAAQVIRGLGGELATEVVVTLREPTASSVLRALEPAAAAILLSRLDPDARERRLTAVDASLATELRELMTFPPGVAGSLMDRRAVAFRADLPARDALLRLRQWKRNQGDVYVVDDEGVLRGAVPVQELALAEPATRLGHLMRQPPRVDSLTPHDELVALVEQRGVSSIPVVDIGGLLLGVIHHADLLSATQRDATADLQTMVGVSSEERALSGVLFAVRRRLPWLQINLLTAFMAAAVVGLFEGTIARFTALAVLLPVVAGQSGNTGAQALAVTMRGLALREIRVRHWLRVARKELMVGAINGVAVALVTALGALVWSRSPGIAAVIGVSMVGSMVVAGVAGASVPMVLIRMRQDPAAASSIVLTTVTDVMGFLTFLGLATLASGFL